MKLTLPSPIQKVIGLVNWKLGPEVLPKSQVLLAASLGAFALAMCLRQMMDYSVARSAASGIGAAAVLSAAAFIGASVSGYRERLTQTLCALALTGAVVVLATASLRFLLVVSLVFADTSEQGLPYVNVMELANFLLFPLFVWNVFVFAALFRRSFRPSVVVSFAIAIPLVMIVDFFVPIAFRSL
jgi:hypothetical protein